MCHDSYISACLSTWLTLFLLSFLYKCQPLCVLVCLLAFPLSIRLLLAWVIEERCVIKLMIPTLPGCWCALLTIYRPYYLPARIYIFSVSLLSLFKPPFLPWVTKYVYVRISTPSGCFYFAGSISILTPPFMTAWLRIRMSPCFSVVNFKCSFSLVMMDT